MQSDNATNIVFAAESGARKMLWGMFQVYTDGKQ